MRNPYNQEQIEHLTDLYLLARETRRQDPPGSSKRAAGDEFAAEIARIRDEPLTRGEDRYTYPEMAAPLIVPNRKTGELEPLNHRTLRAFLGRRGEEENPPSQESYRGNDPDYVPVKPSYRTDEHYSCRREDGEFCERTPENTYEQKFTRVLNDGTVREFSMDICARHKRKAAREYTQRAKEGKVVHRKNKPMSAAEKKRLAAQKKRLAEKA